MSPIVNLLYHDLKNKVKKKKKKLLVQFQREDHLDQQKNHLFTGKSVLANGLAGNTLFLLNS